MQKFTKNILLVFVSIILSSCSTAIDEYSHSDEKFDIKQYFTGNVLAWGIVQDYSAEVNRRFCVEINGSWQGNKGVLAEKFYFDDGEISYRNWQLLKQQDGSYQGTAEDVIGTAIGKHQGFAFQFQYELDLQVGEDNYQVSMDDWMFQLDKSRVMNKTSMSKFGVKIAEVTLFFDKSVGQNKCQ
jgi:hypothetical protein